MTRTERAWHLFLEGWPRISESDAFELAKRFEAEAAKHEEPKAEGGGLYCVAWMQGGEIHTEGRAQRLDLVEARLRCLNKDIADDASFFLVEVRRVK